MQNKAILVVSFGTSYPETRKATIEAVEEKIRTHFPEYEIRRVFTSPRIIRRIEQEENMHIDNLRQALERLQADGFTDVVVQPTHLIPGEEWDKIVTTVNAFIGKIPSLVVSTPLLYGPGDYPKAVEALKKQLPSMGANEAVLLMGHGSPHHPANNVYLELQKILDAQKLPVFIGTVDGPPSLDDLLERLKVHSIQKVTLMPYMLVAGDHAVNDMAGDEEDAWKPRLLALGYAVTVSLRGLGENPAYQEMYIQRVKQAMTKIH